MMRCSIFFQILGQFWRIVGTVLFTAIGLTAIGCGGGTSSTATSGSLSGNWQISMVQNYPLPSAQQLSASGFLQEANNALTGSVEVPYIATPNQSHVCGGASPLTGTVSGQNVTFSLSPGGTDFTFTGGISSDNTSMSGTYQALGGACFNEAATSGTFTAQLIPALNGSFTGTLSDSSYMGQLNGIYPPAPISVSGSLTQSSSAGGSSASISGTITAVGYPCMTTAYVTGTISGVDVYLDVFNYNGEQIGTLGVPSDSPGVAGFPATVVVNSGSVSLQGSGQSGLTLGSASVTGPCPAIGSNNLTIDTAGVNLTLQ